MKRRTAIFAGLAILGTLSAGLAGCTCYALAVCSSEVILGDIPSGPYEVVVYSPQGERVFNCPSEPVDTGAIFEEDGCETGRFSVPGGDSKGPLDVDVDGVAYTLDGDCEKRKICGSKCWSCTYLVE